MKVIKILIIVLAFNYAANSQNQLSIVADNNEIQQGDYPGLLVKGVAFNQIVQTNAQESSLETLMNESLTVSQSDLGYEIKSLKNEFYTFNFSDEDEDGSYDLESFELKRSGLVFKSTTFNIGDSITDPKFQNFIRVTDNGGEKLIILKDREVGASIIVKFNTLNNKIMSIKYSSNN